MATVATRSDLDLQHRLLHGLSDRSRLAILDVLRGGELRVADVVAATGLSQPNASKHLACLWSCGLVARERRGRETFYRPVPGIEDLLAAVDEVLARAGATVGACRLTAATVAAG